MILAGAFFSVPVFASATDGTIDAVSKYAWGSKAGWVNFGATNGAVHVTDTKLTGSAWNDLYGWIKLDPANSGVTNDASGNLSGYAWNDQLGWINFAGVTIDSVGQFAGQASGENIGVLNFSCAHCAVKTDWRSGGGDEQTNITGGSGLPSAAAVNPGVTALAAVINNGVPTTDTTTVNIFLRAGNDVTYAWVAENGDYTQNPVRYNFVAGVTERSVVYLLTNTVGIKTIFVKFCTQWGRCSDNYTSSLTYVYNPPVALPVVSIVTPVEQSTESRPLAAIITEPVKEGIKYFEELFSQAAASLVQNIASTFDVFKSNNIATLFNSTSLGQKLAGAMPGATQLFSNVAARVGQFFGIKPVQQPVAIERLVSAQAPLSMRGQWVMMPPQPVEKFVFAPLPKEFLALQNKFPDLKQTFAQVGVNRFSDVQKLQSAQMYLPVLSQALGITPAKLGLAQYGEMKNLPLGELPAGLKSKIPSDVVFARVGTQLVDSKIALSLTNSGKPEQKITTISGKTMFLTVRPDKAVTRVRGFVVFRSRMSQARAEVSLSDVVASLIFAEPAFAREEQLPVPTEEKLVLQEFEYTDPDGDGLYTAEIQSPIPVGEYEIITVMDYEDPDFGTKQIRLITVVDPEGYVFENIDGKELRIPGAIAALYYFNPDSKQYEQWPAKDFQQENPQITDIRGTYSFLVPGGMYYIAVTAPGYLDYTGKPFAVEEGGGVHLNIEMKTRNWWLKIVDWRTLLLIAVAVLLMYNFYKDKRRGKNK